MKTLIILTLALASLSSFAHTLTEVHGVYKIKPRFLPLSVTVTLNADGSTNLKSKFLGKSYDCNGSSEIKNELLSADLKCNTGDELELNFDVSKVQDIRKFKTEIWTSKTGNFTGFFTKLD